MFKASEISNTPTIRAYDENQCIHDVKTHSFLQRLSVVLTHNQVLLSTVAPVKSRIGPDPLTNRNWPVRAQQLPSSY